MAEITGGGLGIIRMAARPPLGLINQEEKMPRFGGAFASSETLHPLCSADELEEKSGHAPKPGWT